MKAFLYFFVVLFVCASSQDVSVPPDLLGRPTSAPNATEDVEYDEVFTGKPTLGTLEEDTTVENMEQTTTDDEYVEETTLDEEETTTLDQDSSWSEGNNDNVDPPTADSLVRPQFPSVTPFPILPPFNSNCTIQLPPNYFPSNQPPVIVPPIVNSTTDPVEREETLICPVGSVQVGSVCNATFSNECPEGYTFNGERCVIKFTNCPLNFEMNEFGSCVERPLCPHNHVWKNNRCEPNTQCPTGWRWNGERCEVIRVECQPGSVLRGNECVSETFACPIGFDQDGDRCIEPRPMCPPGYTMKENGFCSQVSIRCPPTSVMMNGECRRTTITCPKGTHQVGNQCYQISTERPTCPPGFVLVGDMCNLIPTPKPPEVVCPQGSVKIGNACYYLPTGTDRPVITCPPGFEIFGNRCIPETTTTMKPPIDSVDCPEGFYRVGNACFPYPPPTRPTPPPTRPPIVCPPGFILERNRCVPDVIDCPPGYYLENGRCSPIIIRPPPTVTPTPPTITTPTYPPMTTPSYPPRRCPEGFVFQNNQCYRCPPSFDLCENQCIRRGNSCGQTNYPNININIYTRDHRATDKVHNVIHHIEPVNNTIININNITHPVTLNNVVENNIFIYNDAQCPDGSIRTIVVKNNETINGCIDVDPEKDSDGSRPSDIDEEEEKTPEKCCEVVTPRQCKKREENQWMCTHRRYKYCGKFCIADRLYLKPPATTYRNNVLTILPQQPVHDSPPCFGRNCPPVDCSGCINGSFNCSTQCYTYPCNHASCHYLSEEDFCTIVGGQICEPDR